MQQSDNQNNCVFCDKSMIFGTFVAKGVPNRFGYGGIQNFQHDSHPAIFQNGHQKQQLSYDGWI